MSLELWNSVRTPDKQYTKKFVRKGGFRGTAIDPMYLIMKATSLWGPCGGKWGFKEIEHTIVNDVWYSKVQLWYPGPDGEHVVEHWGGTSIMNEGSPDDEAAKKSMTDALSKCMSVIGFGADIHMGIFDGNKYLPKFDEPKAEEPKTPARKASPSGNANPTEKQEAEKPAIARKDDELAKPSTNMARFREWQSKIRKLSTTPHGELAFGNGSISAFDSMMNFLQESLEKKGEGWADFIKSSDQKRMSKAIEFLEKEIEKRIGEGNGT